MAGAIGILILAGLLLSPATPRPPTAVQLWASRSDRSILAVARDIVELQTQLDRQPAAAAGAGRSATDRLRRDLAQAGAMPPAPDPQLQRAWAMALSEATAAVRILDGPQAGASLAGARADLDAAGQTLVAVIGAMRSAAIIQPH